MRLIESPFFATARNMISKRDEKRQTELNRINLIQAKVMAKGIKVYHLQYNLTFLE